MKTLLEAMYNLKESKDYISEITKIVNKCLEAGLRKELKTYTIPCMRNYQLNFNPTADNRVIPWKFLLNEIKNSKSISWELQDFIDSFIREANNCYNDNIKNLKESNIQGLESYSEDEIKRMTIDYIKTALLYAGYSEDDLKIKDIQIYGSRNRGTAKEDSDLDIVFEYEGDFREDDLFNLLNDGEDPLMFDDIIVDLNPISAERSGDIKSFMNRSKEYDKSKLNEASNYERRFISKVMDIFSYYSFAHYYDNRSDKDQEINEKDFESLENKITVNHDYSLSSKEKKQLETIINYYLNGYNFGDYDNIIPKVVRKRLDNIIKENLHESVWNTKYVDILQKAVDEISKEIPEVTFSKVTDSKYSGPRSRVKIGNIKTTYMYYDGDFFIIGDKYQSYSGTLKEIKKYLKDYVNKYVRIENN